MNHTSRSVFLLVFCLHAGVALVWSETGRLLVLVEDLQNKAVQGVEIGIEVRAVQVSAALTAR